jgi:hypothetical protein
VRVCRVRVWVRVRVRVGVRVWVRVRVTVRVRVRVRVSNGALRNPNPRLTCKEILCSSLLPRRTSQS